MGAACGDKSKKIKTISNALIALLMFISIHIGVNLLWDYTKRSERVQIKKELLHIERCKNKNKKEFTEIFKSCISGGEDVYICKMTAAEFSCGSLKQ